MDKAKARKLLLGSLSERWRPEATVEAILALAGDQLSVVERSMVSRALPRWRHSSMGTVFSKPANLCRQESTIATLREKSSQNPALVRLPNRIARLERARRKRLASWRRKLPALAQFAETSFAPTLTAEDLPDGQSLCFVAWLTARMGMRSVFTNQRQERPFDTISEMLFNKLIGSPRSSWRAVARVFPRGDVLSRLSDRDKLTLLDSSREKLEEVAGYLRIVAKESHISLETMVVHRGNDSSTWNILAGAWNRARDFYFASLDGLGWLGSLEKCCPGKVLRLMAGDVAMWHGGQASDLHPDTKVWRDLPLPWLVLEGKLACGRKDVEAICAKHGVDPKASGWTGPRARAMVEEFRPTPELVYGVEVGFPLLASFLRRVGCFSGKRIRLDRTSVTVPAMSVLTA